ncbi:hypothetical protein [Streptomyces sp. 6N106]|uniref:hypothetical protein n=1 Tax=Streptomyces sp. 6N106 TaxID=3457418 RepID=UPI003FD474E0
MDDSMGTRDGHASAAADAVADGDGLADGDSIAGGGANEGRDSVTGGDSIAAEDGQALAVAVQAVLARVDAHARRATSNGSRPGAASYGGAAEPRDAATTDGHNTPADQPPSTGARGHSATHPAPTPKGISGPATLDALVACFGLSTFERQLVLLAAAAELDPTAAARCAAASGDPTRTYPTFSLALAALDEPH